jgi:hypothetical protein
MRDPRAELMFRVLRVSHHERAFAIDSLLNRLISLSFARQLHAHFFPSSTTTALDDAITDLGVAIRRDTIARLRDALEVVRALPLDDPKAARRFAVDQGLAIGARDMAWRAKTESLWEHLGARGVFLQERRGLSTPRAARSSFGVAAGS